MEPPSLQRLLALKESDSTFEEKLSEGAEVLHLPQPWAHYDSAAAQELGKQYSAQKRAEWLFKWLLENLNTSKKNQPIDPKLVPQSWFFFAWLVTIVPMQTTAKHLSEAKFLDTLRQTLVELNERQLGTVGGALSKSDDTESTPRKKRKRGSKIPVIKETTAGSSNAEILAAVELALQALANSTNNTPETGSTTTSAEQLKTALKTKRDQAIQLLHLWLANLLQAYAADSHCRITLSAVLPIWHESISRGAPDLQELALAFCKTCLVATTNLLIVLKQKEGNSELLQSQLEELLLRQLILPVRSAALAVRPKARRKKDTTAMVDELANQLLQPLHQELLRLIEAHGRYSKEVQALLRGITYIWDLSLRNCQRANPKQKVREEPWLRNFFVALSSCAGNSVTGDWTLAVHPHANFVLCEMLNLCAKGDFSPGLELLESIMRRYSGMCLPEEESIAWNLVAQVLRIDANVFVPGGIRQPTQDLFADAGPLHELIVKHLSSMPWSPEYDRHYVLHAISERDGDDLSSSAKAFKDQNHLTPGDFVTSVPIALMNAYAQARDLTGFLDVWRTELIKSTRHIVIGSGNGSIWEDQTVALAVRDVLESSLTEQQILDILTDLAAPFSQIEEAQNVMYVFTELRRNAQGTGAAANLVLLDAVVAAIRSDAVLEVCCEQLLALYYQSLISVGSKTAINKLPIMHRIWRTLSSIQLVLFPTLPTDQKDAILKDTAASSCTQTAIEAVSEAAVAWPNTAIYERASRAFTFLVSLFANMPAQDDDNVALESCIDCILVDDDLPRQNLAVKLLQFPDCFALISTEKKKAFFDHAVKLAAATIDAPKDVQQQAHEADFRSVLDALVELAKTSFPATVRKELLESLASDLLHPNADERSLSQGNFASSMLTRFPAGMIPRSTREQCLDNLCQIIKSSRERDAKQAKARSEALQCHLAFMAKITQVSNSTARLCKDAQSLLELCDDEVLKYSRQCEALYEELVRQIISHAPTESSFVSDLAEAVLKELKVSKPSLRYVALIAMRPLVTKVDSSLREQLLSCELKALGSAGQRKPDKRAKRTSNDHTDDLGLGILLRSLQAHWSYIEESEAFVKEIHQLDLPQLGTGLVSRLPASKTTVSLLSLREASGSAFDECLAVQTFLQDDQPLQARQQILDDLQLALKKRSDEQKLDAIARLGELESGGNFSDPSLQVLRVLLSSLPRTTKAFPEFDLQIDILARLSTQLGTCTDVKVSGSIFDCIEVILSERGWLVSQHGIDAILAELTVLTSASGPSLPTEYAGAVYIQTCSRVTTAIALQRIKLQGRFHLLMPLLVNLLHCLFTPHSSLSEDSVLRLPPWLSSKSSPLSKRHATAFARLLSTLSSPTIQSVSGHKRRRSSAASQTPLKDEAKVARAYVGEHVPILMAAYCTAQLHGKMAPKVKDALMPGLWSCMETVEMDAWRAMSERMKESERAIWQSVWEEWKRVGGGGHARER